MFISIKFSPTTQISHSYTKFTLTKNTLVVLPLSINTKPVAGNTKCDISTTGHTMAPDSSTTMAFKVRANKSRVWLE